MALYPTPFDDIPSNFSFGKIELEIYVDHYDKSYSFVFPTTDQLVLVEEDEDPVSGGFASANGVQFHTTISQYEQQWTPSTYLDKDLSYEAYCDQDEVLRSQNYGETLLDTYYNSRPVAITALQLGARSHLIAYSSMSGFDHGDEFQLDWGSGDVTYQYLQNRYKVRLFVDGTYTDPPTDPPPGESNLPVYLMKSSDNGMLLSDTYVSEASATSNGWGVESGKAYIIF
tara:strand:+ start:2014 stop:2697 length:684 start_codon:yes stop_codon:yes gene_type:complete